MTQEEALREVMQALAPASLSALQINVFCRAWNKQSYQKIARETNHGYSYIKDVGAELWKLLSQTFDTRVTKLNLQEALAQSALQEQPYNLTASSKRNRVDWGEAVDVSQSCGRQVQLDRLEQWVLHDRCRLVTIVGMGGSGKTMLVTQLAQHLADTGQFERVVWRSLRQAPLLVELLPELLQAIAPDQALPLRVDAMLRQLLEQLRSHRCLLVLDQVEAVFLGRELAGTYRSGYEDYGWLFHQLGKGFHQSSVLLTSREVPTEIALQEAPTAPARLLRLCPMSIKEGEMILAAKGLSFQSQQPQVRELIERYQGNPLALESVATSLKELFGGNITAFLAQGTLLFKDICDLLVQQFDRLSPLERQIMYRLATSREPMSAAQLQAGLLPLISQTKVWDAMVSLDRRSLIETIMPNSGQPTALTESNGIRYTQQSMVMEYVNEQLIEQVHQESGQDQIDKLRSHGLIQSQAKDNMKILTADRP